MPRFPRLRASNKPRRLLLGVHPVPTLVTLGNLVCGLGSVLMAMRAGKPGANSEDCLYWSGIFIFAAMIFDVMDGKVARWTRSASKFGMEMDSLCDVVSFGVAPAVLVKSAIDLQLSLQSFTGSMAMLADILATDQYVLPMLAVYACSACIRLARYNVEAETGHRDFFFGMPSPGAAGCVASLVILIIPGNHPHLAMSQLSGQMTLLESCRKDIFGPVLLALPFIMLILGVLMISRVHYPHVGDRMLRGRKSFMHLMLLGLILTLFIMKHEIMLAAAFNGYMLFGLLNEVRYMVFPSQRPPEWVKAVAAASAIAIAIEPPAATPTAPPPIMPSKPKNDGKEVKEPPPIV